MRQDSGNAPARYYLSVFCQESGNTRQGQEIYQQALALEPSALFFYGADGFYGRGLAHCYYGEHQQALSDLTWAAHQYSFRQATTMQQRVIAAIDTPEG